jgi:hypothetical protein
MSHESANGFKEAVINPSSGSNTIAPPAQLVLDDAPIATRKSKRARRIPARFLDNAMDLGSEGEDDLPEPLVPLDAGASTNAVALSSPALQQGISATSQTIRDLSFQQAGMSFVMWLVAIGD